jgi:hypothetical protein
VCRVAPGGCPPGAPTDPDVRSYRIRLFRSSGSLRGGRALCPGLHRVSDDESVLCFASFAIRSSLVEMGSGSDVPLIFPSAVHCPGRSLCSAGSRSVPVPHLHSSYERLRLLPARPRALRFLRLLVPTTRVVGRRQLSQGSWTILCVRAPLRDPGRTRARCSLAAQRKASALQKGVFRG